MNNLIVSVIVSAVIAIASAAGYLVVVGPHAPTPPSGATSVQVTDGDCLFINGQHICGTTKTLRTATTTPCAIKSPNATSTLVRATLQLNVATATASVWDLAKASNAFATTTLMDTAYHVAASAMALIEASTTPTAGQKNIFAPNTYIVFGERGGITAGDTAGTGFVPAGSCTAQFVY